jgi:U3 small nucleolar RNA-associated protein 14
MSEEDFNLENYMINSFFSHQKAEEARLKYNSYRSIIRKKQLKIVEKIASQIEFEKINEREGNKNNGSLYRLFNSDYFDIDFVMFYLEKHEENGILDTIINIIYEKFINDSIFYLPQLW